MSIATTVPTTFSTLTPTPAPPFDIPAVPVAEPEAPSPSSADDRRVRAARGAAWLDEREPGWWRGIDEDRLNLANGCRCILGQLYGAYHLALSRFQQEEFQPGGSRPYVGTGLWAHDHGFVEDIDSGRPVWEALEACWFAEIARRHDRDRDADADAEEGRP